VSALNLVEPDWLALRGAADDAARSAELAALVPALLPAGPAVIHDLGSGAGALPRWLAPRLPGPQTWVLRDGDPRILRHAELRSVVDGDGRPVDARPHVEELGALPPDAFAGAALVTASALLDVLTAGEAARVVAACVAAGVPALFSLTVTGGASPDSALAAAFDDHQRRERDGRRLLGPDAVPWVAELFDAAGWQVRTVATPWRLGPGDRDLIEAWLDGWLAAALEQRPALRAEAAERIERLRTDAGHGRLAVTVPHEDLLAWPV
jgi:hypothetical protein